MKLVGKLTELRSIYSLRETRIAALLGALFALLIVVILLSWGSLSRDATLREWEAIAQSMARTLAQEVSQSLRTADLVLKSIGDQVQQAGLQRPEQVPDVFHNRATFDTIRNRALVAPQVDVATITDKDGNVVNFTRSWPPPPINLSDRDYFKALISNANLKSFLSIPVQNRGTGTWTFYLARPIRALNGSFLGVLLTGLHSGYYEMLFNSAAISSDMSVSLFRTDGFLLARYPVKEEFLGKSFAQRPVFTTLVNRGDVGKTMITSEPRMTSGGQKELRIIAPSSVPGYPLLVSVTIGADLVFAGWQNAAFWVGVTVSTLLLIILFLTHIAAKLLYAQALALRDLSHEKQRADSSAGELLRLSRLSTMQEMSSAIAHELNQPLAATANYLSVAAMRLNAAGGSDWARQSEVLDKAQQQVQRAGEIIRRLRNFISRGKSEESRTDIYGIIESAISFSLVRDQHADIALTCPKTTEKLYVQVDSIQIQQVLMNLIRNAVEAMENQSDKRLTIAARTVEGGKVEVSVRDNGPGLPAEIREQVFHPFNTTKAKGMGVGLSICRTIVEAHGGTIRVDDGDGGGTTFRFTLSMMPE